MELDDGIAAIVTGGASGLEGATATMLAAQGARVAIFDLYEDRGHEQARATGGAFFRVNVADDANVAQSLAGAEAAQGPPRILVNCAGICPAIKTVDRDLQPHPLDAFHRAIAVNLLGTFNLVSKFAARLARCEPVGEECGVIVNTALAAAFDGHVGQAAYSAAKGDVARMTLPLARDLTQHYIRVMAIAPGTFLTPMLQGLSPAVQYSLAQQVPHPSRLGRPEEFAQMVAAIIANPMLNGEVIRLDGALRMAPR